MKYSTFPDEDEYGSYYAGYIANARSEDVKASLRENRDLFLALFSDISDDKMDYRYRDEAWSLKEMVQHITDTERVFAYRAMCVARGDEGPFPGFDHEAYVAGLDLTRMNKEQLIFDFVMQRNALISMLSNFSEEEWTRRGVASGSPVSVRAIAHIVLGHCRHHLKMIEERYLSE